MSRPLPPNWSITNWEGQVVVQLPAAAMPPAHVLSRNELRAVFESLARAVADIDTSAEEAMAGSFGALGVIQGLEGWSIYVFARQQEIVVEVYPCDSDGRYVLSVEEASRLWRNLVSAYLWSAIDVQDMIRDADARWGVTPLVEEGDDLNRGDGSQ